MGKQNDCLIENINVERYCLQVLSYSLVFTILCTILLTIEIFTILLTLSVTKTSILMFKDGIWQQ